MMILAESSCSRVAVLMLMTLFVCAFGVLYLLYLGCISAEFQSYGGKALGVLYYL